MSQFLMYPLLIVLVGCQFIAEDSRVSVVDIPQTPSEKQTTGNCWAFGMASWIEAQVKKHENRDINISESYFLYRHLEDQLLNSPNSPVTLQAGSFGNFRNLVLKFGVMEEKDFISEEVETDTNQQKVYFNAVKKALKSGTLAGMRPRTKEAVRKALDHAFGVKLNEIPKQKFKTLSEYSAGSEYRNLQDLWNQLVELKWKEASRNDYPISAKQTPFTPDSLTNHENSLLKSIKKALLDEEPVFIVWQYAKKANPYVEGSFSDKTEIVDIENLRKYVSETGRFGGADLHLTVARDFTASIRGTNGEVVESFSLGALSGDENEVRRKRQRILENAQIESIVLKNSWGVSGGFDYFGNSGNILLMRNYLVSFVHTNFLGAAPVIETVLMPAKYVVR